MRKGPQRKTGLQHTTVVWYRGSCTNKHDNLMDTSIQMQKFSASFTDVPYLAGTVNHATKNETAKITVAPYLAGTVNHVTKSEMARLLTLYSFGTWMY